MRGFLSILITVTLFAHAMLGCCPDLAQTIRADTQVSVRLAGGCRGPETRHGHSVLGARQCCDHRPQREDSSECRCVFSHPAKVRSAKSPLVRSPVAALLSPLAAVRAVSNHSERHLRTSGARTSSSRLHLVHQVLLI